MRSLSIGFLTAALAAAPLSSASAHGFHHRGFGFIGGLFHVVGAVVVGAATIATAPIAIVADAASGQRNGYDDERGGYRGRPTPYGDDYQRGSMRDGYYGAPDYGYPAPRNYYPRASYGPRGGYDSYGYYGSRYAYGPPPDYRPSGGPYDDPRDHDNRYARRNSYSGQY
jgi:hypothetical protein